MQRQHAGTKSPTTGFNHLGTLFLGGFTSVIDVRQTIFGTEARPARYRAAELLNLGVLEEILHQFCVTTEQRTCTRGRSAPRPHQYSACSDGLAGKTRDAEAQKCTLPLRRQVKAVLYVGGVKMLVSAQVRQCHSDALPVRGKIEKQSRTIISNDLSQSLHFIKAVKQELANLGKGSAAPADLALGVKLCNMLLSEVAGVSRRIAGELKSRPPRAFASGRADLS